MLSSCQQQTVFFQSTKSKAIGMLHLHYFLSMLYNVYNVEIQIQLVIVEM